MQLPDSQYESEKIVGMRAFRLSITIANLSQPVLVDFIVSDSPTPPSWNSITDHPAKISRTFDNAANQKRKIYFSVTNEYQAKKGDIKVDLSTEASKEAEDKASKREAPGLMLPATDYYVHAYSKGLHVKTSAAITTVGYPPPPSPFLKPAGNSHNYSDYAWNMDMWQAVTANKAEDSPAYNYLEVGKKEVAYLPFRYQSPLDQRQAESVSGTVCPGTTDKRKILFGRSAGDFVNGRNLFKVAVRYLQGKLTDAIAGINVFAFVSSPRLPETNPPDNPNQVLDAMIKVRRLGDVKDDGSPLPLPASIFYRINTTCFNGDGAYGFVGIPIYAILFVDQ